MGFCAGFLVFVEVVVEGIFFNFLFSPEGLKKICSSNEKEFIKLFEIFDAVIIVFSSSEVNI